MADTGTSANAVPFVGRPRAMAKIKYSETRPRSDRRHYVNREDVEVILDRLPPELWSRLRAVHFNDRSRGVRCLGYVNRGRREIALCALPPRVSLTRFLRRPTVPSEFGARRGAQWPHLAIRRWRTVGTGEEIQIGGSIH